ncbi:MAG: hypothetical protein MZV49_13855 [Rhodopseudomonas palustris]|nr:hypothetical protein [Rhodopseudomonas palustris]
MEFAVTALDNGARRQPCCASLLAKQWSELKTRSARLLTTWPTCRREAARLLMMRRGQAMMRDDADNNRRQQPALRVPARSNHNNKGTRPWQRPRRSLKRC